MQLHTIRFMPYIYKWVAHSLVGKTTCSYGQNRKEKVVLTRGRKSHSRLTHSYILYNEERSECIPCNSIYSANHVLVDCIE